MKPQMPRNHANIKHKGGISYLTSENSRKVAGLIEIAFKMKKADLPEIFIVNTLCAALEFEGIADLMKLWRDEKIQEEKNEIVADIQEMLDACSQKSRAEEFYVKFNDLDTIANNIRLFKDSLLFIVKQNGGVKRLAELTDIPQPSLSRFFNSNAMPQRGTLIKIAKALGLDEIKMEGLWIKEKHIKS